MKRITTSLLALLLAAAAIILVQPEPASAQSLFEPMSCPGQSTTLDASVQQKDGIDPDFQQWVDKSYGGQDTRSLGANTGNDEYFARSFDIPENVNIDSAYVRVTVKRGGGNDALNLRPNYPDTTTPIWGSSLEDLGVGNNQTETLHLALGNLPKPNGTTKSNLTYDLMPAVIQEGSLDIVIQDDSPVLALSVVLCTSTPCPGESIVIDATQKQGDGIDDDFQTAINSYGGKKTRDLGPNTGNDQYFGRTLDIPSNVHIHSAYITATITRGGSNDGMGIWANGATKDLGWGSRLGDLGVSKNTNVTLALTNLPKPATGPHPNHTYDLLPALIQEGSMDIAIQDDSPVSELSLVLCISTPCPNSSIVVDATQQQADGIDNDFQAAINSYGGKKTRDLGPNTGNDQYFGRSLDIPSNVNIQSAFLVATVTRKGGNDGMGVWPNGATKDLGWGSRLNDAGYGSSATTQEFPLSNLAKPSAGPHPNHTYNLLPALIQEGSIDIAIQDDSPVSELYLVLCTP